MNGLADGVDRLDMCWLCTLPASRLPRGSIETDIGVVFRLLPWPIPSSASSVSGLAVGDLAWFRCGFADLYFAESTMGMGNHIYDLDVDTFKAVMKVRMHQILWTSCHPNTINSWA
jgi:hypothetical protein